jgi:hypothetical protein
MSLSTKILIAILAIVLLCAGGLIVFKEVESAKQVATIQQSIVDQKQLLDNILRAQSQFASKDDIAAYAKQQGINLDTIQKDLDSFHAQIQAINGITVISTGQTGNNVPSTTTTPRPDSPNIPSNSDPYGYLSNTQRLTLNEKFSNTEVPFGTVGFSAWQDKPWDIAIADRKYSITSVLGQDDSGKHYSYSKLAISTGGKTYDINIDDNKFMEENPTAKFSWLNPRLFMIANGGIGLSTTPVKGEFTPGVTVGLMSYGATKTNPTLSVLQLGVGYGTVNHTAEFSLSPVQYNIGQHLQPFLNNTFVGPVIQLNTKGNITAGAGLSVGF